MECTLFPYLVIIYVFRGVAGNHKGWELTYSPSRDLCVLRGSNLTMMCDYVYPANLSVRSAFWTVQEYGDQPVTEDSRYEGRASVDCGDMSHQCTLRLVNVTTADTQHKYYCRVITQQQKQKWTGRPGVKLTLTDLQVRTPGHLREGKAVNLTCFSNCTLSGSDKFVWQKNGVKVINTNHQTLRLTSLTNNDEGRYTCAVDGYEDRQSPPLQISIAYPPKDVLVFVCPSGAILKGSSVTLACISDANPPVDIYTWFKKNINHSLGSGHQYSIKNANFDVTGQYYCEAKNALGAETSTDMFIKTEDECSCLMTVSVGTSVVSGVVMLFSCVFFMISRWWKRKDDESEEDSDDEKDKTSEPEQEENDYGNCRYGNAIQHEEDDYGNCQYGNAVQMDSVQEDTYDTAQDDDIYQNVDSISM
ncbi:B-cell receptor CD22-like [Sardina pilchardus]|uniref:B-cell receptor CD22-like n=1 Tax=Sardina pilchardus TaxID=27697 RepID=UPI002E1080C7